jgi:hypothetical protein
MCTADLQTEATHHVPQLFRADREPGQHGHRILVLHASTEAANMQYSKKLLVRSTVIRLHTLGSFPAACCPHGLLCKAQRAVFPGELCCDDA